MAINTGTRLGRYVIRSKLGEGGMGEVYLAEDTLLERTVALKVLPANVASDRRRMQRFMQEARAASSLNHPNIITIHEIGEADSTHFIATEFIKGPTLRQRMAQRKMSIDEALDVSLQTTAALSAAHEAGVIHRDIKPENIMVRHDGLVKVLDFGLAKLTEKEDEAEGTSADTQAPTRFLVKTMPGTLMGTVQYMSPEQARGLELDHRTDIFSLGALLYELLTGRLPFAGETMSDVIAAILKTEPAPPREINREIPTELNRIVLKALAKNPAERYQTANEFSGDLRRLRRELELQGESQSAPPPEEAVAEERATQLLALRPTVSSVSFGQRIKEQKVALALLLSVLLIAAVGAAYWAFKGGSASPSSNAAPIDSIAVLPFINGSGSPDMEYLSDGITESLINNLSRLQSLRVIARSTVFSFKGREVPPQQIGQQLNVRAILTGRVVQRGDTLNIQVDMVDTTSGAQIWGESYRRRQADILLVQEEIARDVTDRLRLKLTGEDRQLLAKRYTNSSEAYEYYLKGRFHYYRLTDADWQKALDSFNRAVAKDPDYALAYAGIADCYGIASGWLMPPTEAYPKLEAAALKALRVDNTLADAWAALASVKLFYEHDWAGAERELKHALGLNPDSTPARLYYSFYLYAQGRTDECVALLKEGLQSDPLSLPLNTNLGEALYYARRYDEALEVSKKTLEIDRNSVFGLSLAGWAHQQKGQYEDAIAQFQKIREQEGDNLWAIASLGNVYAVSGRRDEALKILADLQAIARRRYVSPYFFALIYTGLGDKDQAMAYLNKAYDEHNDYLIYLRVEPLFDQLRSDARFIDLMRRVGL